MKKYALLILALIVAPLFAENKVVIVSNGTVGADNVIVTNQKIEISTGSFFQVISTNGIVFGDGSTQTSAIQSSDLTGGSTSYWNLVSSGTNVNQSNSTVTLRLVTVTSETVNTTLTASTVAIGTIILFPNGSSQTIAAVAQSASSSSILNGLVITTNSNNTNQLVLTANAIDIGGCYFENYSTSAFLNLVGAGGLDAGSEAANTTYVVWPIAKTDCSTSSVVVSSYSNVRPSQVTLPAGYTKIRGSPIGVVVNDGSSNILPTYQQGNKFSLWTEQVVLNTGSPATSFTTINLTSILPPGTVSFDFEYQTSTPNPGTDARFALRPSNGPTNATNTGTYYGGVNGSGLSYIQWNNTATAYLFGSRNVDYKDNVSNPVGALQILIQSYVWGGF